MVEDDEGKRRGDEKDGGSSVMVWSTLRVLRLKLMVKGWMILKVREIVMRWWRRMSERGEVMRRWLGVQ